MKSVIIIFLSVLAVVLGFNVFTLQKNIAGIKRSASFCDKRSDELRSELIRVSKAYDENKRALGEIEEAIAELENKIQIDSLQRSIPKKTWDEIRPIIDRLRGKEGLLRLEDK